MKQEQESRRKERKNFFDGLFEFVHKLKFRHSIVYWLLFIYLFSTIYPTFFSKFDKDILQSNNAFGISIKEMLLMALTYHFGKNQQESKELVVPPTPPMPTQHNCENCPNNKNLKNGI